MKSNKKKRSRANVVTLLTIGLLVCLSIGIFGIWIFWVLMYANITTFGWLLTTAILCSVAIVGGFVFALILILLPKQAKTYPTKPYKVKITVAKITLNNELMEKYENPIKHACALKVGDSFISVNARKPDDFCDSAWSVIYPFVKDLAEGKSNFYGGWMKDPDTAMISCNDGFRPVSFLLEKVKNEEYEQKN